MIDMDKKLEQKRQKQKTKAKNSTVPESKLPIIPNKNGTPILTIKHEKPPQTRASSFNATPHHVPLSIHATQDWLGVDLMENVNKRPDKDPYVSANSEYQQSNDDNSCSPRFAEPNQFELNDKTQSQSESKQKKRKYKFGDGYRSLKKKISDKKEKRRNKRMMMQNKEVLTD